jgi:AcrR family transcriptional regulator
MGVMTTTKQGAKRPYAPRMAPEERREQLLDAVLAVIVKQGVHKVSIDSVAKEAGVTRPVVYGHFVDSNALLRASLDRETERGTEQWTAAMPAVGDGTPADAAVRLVDGFLSAVLEAPDRWRAAFAIADSSTPAFRRRVAEARQLAVATVTDLVRWAVAGGPDEDTDVDLVAHFVVAVLWDAGRLVLDAPEEFPVDRVRAFAARSAARYFGT